MITLLAVTEAFCMEHPKGIYLLKNKELQTSILRSPTDYTHASDLCFAFLLTFVFWSTQ